MAINIVEIPANLVKHGDVVFHDGRGYPIVHINRLSDVVQLQHSGGFFNFELGRIVRVLEKRPTTEYFTKPTTTRAVLAHEVRPGDILSYGIRFFEIKEVKDLGEIPENVVRLTHVTGYFDFSHDRIVHIVNNPPASETPTATFNTQINPTFLPYEEVKPILDEEDVKGADVEVGDVIWYKGNWATVTNTYKHPYSPYNKVNIDHDGVKGLQVRLTLSGTYSRKVRAAMETLNIQNAIEAQRILLQKLEQMLDLQQLAPTEDGKIAIGNCNIRVDKATVIKAARDEMKAAASKSAELVKKL